MYSLPRFSSQGTSLSVFSFLCDLVDEKPWRFPAIEKSWQGNPPVTTSIFLGNMFNPLSLCSLTRSTMLSRQNADLSMPRCEKYDVQAVLASERISFENTVLKRVFGTFTLLFSWCSTSELSLIRGLYES